MAYLSLQGDSEEQGHFLIIFFVTKILEFCFSVSQIRQRLIFSNFSLIQHFLLGRASHQRFLERMRFRFKPETQTSTCISSVTETCIYL